MGPLVNLGELGTRVAFHAGQRQPELAVRARQVDRGGRFHNHFFLRHSHSSNKQA
jgi:hypothetical protein